MLVSEKMNIATVEPQWLEHLWNHENMFETGIVRANEFTHRAKSGGIIGIFSRFSFTLRYVVYSH